MHFGYSCSPQCDNVVGCVCPDPPPTSWEEFIDSESTKLYMQGLREFLLQERREHVVFPAESQVLRAFVETPLDQVRVVVLGQDPYFAHPKKRFVGDRVKKISPAQAEVSPACGLAFAVPPGAPLQHSLAVILKEMEEDLGAWTTAGDFASLAPRGVLLLNRILTVRAGRAKSHADRGWETFTRAALKLVAMQPRQIGFLLMGGDAHRAVEGIDLSRHAVVKTPHPACRPPLSFRGSRPFSRLNAILEQPFDWRLT